MAVYNRQPGADWTTGQGIGFLVALPGYILTGLAVLVGGVGILTDVHFDTPVRALIFGAALLGIVLAIPGTIVFSKCKIQ